MRPDAIPVRPVGSRAVLPPAAVAALFGAGTTLRGTERVQVVRLGRVVATVRAEVGADLALHLDRLDLDALADAEGVRLQGPVSTVSPPLPVPVRSCLALPDALRRAWNVGETAALALGSVAVEVPVAGGPEALAEVERALWLGAGRPSAARWLPALTLAPPDPPALADRVRVVPRRVVTETDVRQARLRHQRIRVEPGQVVTPAARSLGREWDVFEG